MRSLSLGHHMIGTNPMSNTLASLRIPEPTVIRQFSIPTELFDWFTESRTRLEREADTRLTISQVMALILHEHRTLLAQHLEQGTA